MTIMGMLAFASYIPYAHYQKKALIRQGLKEISQSLQESRNLAINGVDTGSGNVHVVLAFEPDGQTLSYYSYPFSDLYIPQSYSDIQERDTLLKTKTLPQGIYIESVAGNASGSILAFEAISGSGTWEIFESSERDIEIQLSYMHASDEVLRGTLQYYLQSYISDY